MNFNTVKFKYIVLDTRWKGVKMKRKSQIAVSCIIIALILGMVVAYTKVLANDEVYIRAVADVSELGDPVLMPNVINTTFNVAIYVEDTNLTTDMNLYGFDIQFNWTTEWIHYTSYTVTQPVEDYPTVQAPSPYAGILHADTMKLKKTVDESASIPSSEPGAMAWIGYSSVFPAVSFNGSGTICVFNFKVIDQPYNYEGAKTIEIHFIKTDLSNPTPGPITHTAEDLEITLYPRNITYPPSPMLKVTPDFVTGYYLGDTFDLNVTLLGADGSDLDSFWDVAGCEFYMNFNTTMLQALDIQIDPEYDPDTGLGGFGGFWSEGTWELAQDIDNTAGWVHISFTGWGETHDPVNGTIVVATINFNVTYESPMNQTEPIDLENPLVPANWYIMDADGGLIDLTAPVGTDWTTLFPYSLFPTGFNVTAWDDVNGDGELSAGDQIVLLNKATLKWYHYKVNATAVTIQLAMQPFPATDDYLWATDAITPDGIEYSEGKCLSPVVAGQSTTAPCDLAAYDGDGKPNWTGNFTLDYPWTSITSITAHYVANGTERVLTEGVDYVAHVADQLVELLKPIDVNVVNEYHNTTEWGPAGWPYLDWMATGFDSVYVDYNNGTPGHYAVIGPFEEPPPTELWYEPDYPCEAEGWYVLDWGSIPESWPLNSSVLLNYTAASYLTIDYNCPPDPEPYYMEYQGTIDDFYAIQAAPNATSWTEAYPDYNNMWQINDTDAVEIENELSMVQESGLPRDFIVDNISIDIKVIREPCVQDVDTAGAYYCNPVIVEIAGYPHPERDFSPWFGSDDPVRLPNTVENGTFQAIPEFNGLFVLMSLMLATLAIAVTRKLPKKK
jgi:hypothetical protein